MNNLYFSDQFIPAIIEGRKTQTIREIIFCHLDDSVSLFSKRRYIRTVKVNRIAPVHIDMNSVSVNHCKLTGKQLSDFVTNEGFNSLDDLTSYLNQLYPLPFKGFAIYW